MAPPKGSPRPIGAGRAKGTPNRVTTLIKEAAARRIVQPASGEVNGFERMVVMAKLLDKIAGDEFAKIGKRQVIKDDKTIVEVQTGDPKLVSDLAAKAAAAWDRVTQYQRPRLASTHMTVERVDLSKLTDEELAFLDAIREKADPLGRDTDREGETRH